jgi:hypothetical protein
MSEARKRPCSICRRWFRPDPRVGDRQHVCGKAECQTGRRRKTQASWRYRNPAYAVAYRLDQRAACLPSPPEPLRFPPPMNKLPWDVAEDQFGSQGADFIGVMGALIIRTAKDQCRAYLVDSTALPNTLPLLARKTSADSGDTEPRAANDATGVSPTGPAMATSASPRIAPAEPVARLTG